MLIVEHINHTMNALDHIKTKLPEDEKNYFDSNASEILKGCLINDLLTISNEVGSLLIKYVELTRAKPLRKDSLLLTKEVDKKKSLLDILLGKTLIYDSHFGKLASLHIMAITEGHLGNESYREVQLWWSFLNAVTLGHVYIKPDEKMKNVNHEIKSLFAGEDHKVSKLFDTSNRDEIRYRSIGMLLHLIQDSFTPSHCERNAQDMITEFHAYGVQDSHKHKESDYADPSKITQLNRHMEGLLFCIFKNETYDFKKVFPYSQALKPAGPGEKFRKNRP